MYPLNFGISFVCPKDQDGVLSARLTFSEDQPSCGSPTSLRVAPWPSAITKVVGLFLETTIDWRGTDETDPYY
jgi:hypothetical protein